MFNAIANLYNFLGEDYYIDIYVSKFEFKYKNIFKILVLVQKILNIKDIHL